jgi:nitrogen PTS system EIIA component
MVLGSVFSRDRIKIGLESEDKEEAFEELVDLYVSRNPSASRAEMLAAIRSRESKLSTGIKGGFAFPHAQTNQVDSVRGLVGISQTGIDYDSLDGKPIHVIFMLFSSTEGCALHLRALKRLSYLIDDPDFYRNIMSLRDPDSVYAVICKYEEMLATSM